MIKEPTTKFTQEPLLRAISPTCLDAIFISKIKVCSHRDDSISHEECRLMGYITDVSGGGPALFDLATTASSPLEMALGFEGF